MTRIFPHLPIFLRHLLRQPGFTLIVILTLGVAIGSNAAIFSVVQAVLIRPLPYPDSERLVKVAHTAPGVDVPEFGQADGTYLIYREHNQVLEEIGIYRTVTVNLDDGDRPEEISATRITPSGLSVLGVSPRLGRRFSEKEGQPGTEATVILSHGTWAQRFGANPEIVGATVRVEGDPHTVIGVMPTGFHFPDVETRLWLPLAIDPAKADTGNFLYEGIGRLRSGIEPSVATAEISTLVKILPEEATNPHLSAELIEDMRMAGLVKPLRDDVVGEISGVLQILLGSVGLILLIACANLTNLFLVRFDGRYRELAVRSALGASRGWIARSLLSESLLLALAGGAVGLGLAAAAVRVVGSLEAHKVPRLEEVTLDGGVILFTLAISLLSGLLFGALPAWRGVPQLSPALREGSGLTPGRSRRHTRNLLVIAQIAFALILLVGSGLMVGSWREVLRIDPGFQTEGVLTLRLTPPAADYPDNLKMVAFSKQVLDKVRALPGVTSAGIVNHLPLADEAAVNTHIFEDFPPDPGVMPPFHPNRLVSPGYFESLGIPLVEGRRFEQRDLERPTAALVVSEALARHYWPGESAVGKRLRPETTAPGTWHTIVGVVGNARDDELIQSPAQSVYYPLLSRAVEEGREISRLRHLNLVVRTSLPPTSLVGAVGSAVREVDRSVSVARVQEMAEVVAKANARTLFLTLLLLIAAAMAVGLGTVGLYGVISYTVSQRTHEIAVRMALGADRIRVSRMVLSQGLGLAVVGILLGLAGAVPATRQMEALLFGVSATDPIIFAVVALVVLGITLLASFIPAQRAARVDPLAALRHE